VNALRPGLVIDARIHDSKNTDCQMISKCVALRCGSTAAYRYVNDKIRILQILLFHTHQTQNCDSPISLINQLKFNERNIFLLIELPYSQTSNGNFKNLTNNKSLRKFRSQ
jgi:hypothetical protein